MHEKTIGDGILEGSKESIDENTRARLTRQRRTLSAPRTATPSSDDNEDGVYPHLNSLLYTVVFRC